jgi:hypothetical protein
MFATIGLFLITSISLGIYLFSNGKNSNLNENKSNEVAEKLSSSNTFSNSQETIEPSNSNIDISTPESTPTPIPTPNKKQLGEIKRKFSLQTSKLLTKNYWSQYGKDDDWKFISDGEFTDLTDLDNDGDKDAVTVFSFCESLNCHTTTRYSYLVFFRNDGGNFTQVSAHDLQSLYAVVKTISGNKIYLQTTNLKESDPHCCPSDIRRITYALVGNKLKRL